MLEIKDVYKSYDKDVLKGVNFQVDTGEIIGIVGTNGCGKSTLVSIITNNIKADKGTVLIDGNDVLDKGFDPSKFIGYVPQENVLFNKLTVKQNIDFWSSAYKTTYDSLYFDKHLFNEKVGTLSGGNKKILSIELSLIAKPKYLIMDEPTSALDLVNQQKVIDLINDYKSKGNSVLFITHHINEINQCDKIVVLQDGIVKYFDKPTNIIENEESINKILKGE